MRVPLRKEGAAGENTRLCGGVCVEWQYGVNAEQVEGWLLHILAATGQCSHRLADLTAICKKVPLRQLHRDCRKELKANSTPSTIEAATPVLNSFVQDGVRCSYAAKLLLGSSREEP